MFRKSRLSATESGTPNRWSLAALMIPAFLAGCTVATPPTISSTLGSLPNGGTVQLAPFESDGTLRGAFGEALEQTFSEHGIVVEEGSATIAEFAIAARNASGGVADPAASTPDAIVWESLPRDSHWTDECEAIRLRATLVLLNRADSTLAYRGVAESDVCAYSQADLRALADTLVADAR